VRQSLFSRQLENRWRSDRILNPTRKSLAVEYINGGKTKTEPRAIAAV
jgi:hypothetical protein